MIALYIDSKTAVLTKGTRFRLTRENPLFTNAGDFTLEVLLPLANCPENQIIFGALHRPEVGKSKWVGRRLPFRLVAHPMEVTGFLVVLGVTDDDVKVQLLGGRSAINASMKTTEGKDIYIDELPLGRAYEEIFAKRRPGKEQTMRATMEVMYSSANDAALRYGSIEQTDTCCFPIVSTKDNAVANATAMVGYRTRVGTLNVQPYWPLERSTTAFPPSETTRLRADNVFAPQPYLVVIIERVIRALGLRIDAEDNEIRQTWMKNIIIANVRGTLELRHILPHWTVREFFEQVQNFFGVVVELDGERVRIVRKKNRYQTGSGQKVVELKEVIDAYSAELEQGDRPENPFTGNVGYKFTEINPLLQIPEDVYQHSEVLPSLPSVKEMMTYDRLHSNKIYQSGWVRQAWIHLDDGKDELQPVDTMGHLMRNTDRKLDIELKIVPVQTAADSPTLTSLGAYVVQIFKESMGRVEGFVEEFQARVPLMAAADSRTVPDIEPYSVGAALRNQKQITQLEKRDVMEVAINMTGQYITPFAATGIEIPTKYPFAIGNPFTAVGNGEVVQVAPVCALILYYPGSGLWLTPYPRVFLEGLNPIEQTEAMTSYWLPPDNIQATAFSSPLAAETSSKWIIDFADNGEFNPADVYLIRGRKFLCEKIEISLNDSGIEPIKRGYFYEVE